MLPSPRTLALTLGAFVALGSVSAPALAQDEIDWPEDAEQVDDDVDWPEEAEAPEDEGSEDEGSSAAGPAVERLAPSADVSSPVADALREKLSAPHTLRTNQELFVSYAMQGASEVEDFDFLGFDKFEVCEALRGAGAYSESLVGLECGVSSQRPARMRHVVALEEECEIDVRLWVNAATRRSKLVFLLGDKIGVNWGQQIAKVSKRGSIRPLAGRVDRNAFRGERIVRLQLRVKDNELTVRLDGRQTAKKTFKPGELQGHFGFLAKGVRLQILELKIRGIVDASKL
jgi:hypothetical protein